MITLLVTPEEFDREELQVGGERYRHLFRARRVAAGERLRLTDGAGRARWGEVTSVDRSTGTVAAGEPAPSNEPPLYLELFCAIPKPERAAWLVEKATEIGAAAIRFVQSERAPRDLTPSAVSRLSRVAAAAVEQCHRARLPEVSGTHAWNELPELLAACEMRYVLDPRGPSGVPAAGDSPASAALAVGPEGGWSPEELAALERGGCRPFRLGARVLRIETAAVVGTALLLAGRD